MHVTTAQSRFHCAPLSRRGHHVQARFCSSCVQTRFCPSSSAARPRCAFAGGPRYGLDSPSQSPRTFGAYCFKLNFTPVAVIANSIAHPNDSEFGPILYTAGPNVTGQFTKDKNGRGVECPAGFQHAAVVGRSGAGDGISVPPGGFFVMFFG